MAAFCLLLKEAALLHANFAMDSIPHALQAFLMIAGGVIGLLAAFSLAADSSDGSASSLDARSSGESRVVSSRHVPVERGAPGRRF